MPDRTSPFPLVSQPLNESLLSSQDSLVSQRSPPRADQNLEWPSLRNKKPGRSSIAGVLVAGRLVPSELRRQLSLQRGRDGAHAGTMLLHRRCTDSLLHAVSHESSDSNSNQLSDPRAACPFRPAVSQSGGILVAAPVSRAEYGETVTYAAVMRCKGATALPKYDVLPLLRCYRPGVAAHSVQELAGCV